MTDWERRIQSCVDHINTAVDVDPWAKELVAEMGKEILKAQLSKEDTTSDCISRRGAIDAIFSEPLYESGMKKRDADAVVPAIYEKIKSLPSTETHEERTETHACDCVSRQAAIDAMAELQGRASTKAELKGISKAWKWIKKLPSAQPEIVPCGDCKHWICHDRRCGYWNHGVKPLEWCCHAERKENR